MKIGFIGVGKLGKDAAEVMAEHHDVIGYDIEEVHPSNFEMVDTLEDVCKDREIIFIAVPTPHEEEYDGRYPTSHLPPKDFNYDIVSGILDELNSYTTKEQLVVLISTVLPGTIRREFIPLVKNYRFIYNPYLIAMGTVKWDMVNPEMVIIGTDDGSYTGDAKLLTDFYETFITKGTRYEVGTWDEAEAIKIFYNTFISTKVVLVNMIQDVAERIGNINADVVAGALAKSNKRITSSSYMKPGMGDGGGCVLPTFKVMVNGDEIEIEHLYNSFNKESTYLVESSTYSCSKKDLKKIYQVTRRKYVDELYTIELESGKKIQLTKDHIIPVKRNGTLKLIKVVDLVATDKLYIL